MYEFEVVHSNTTECMHFMKSARVMEDVHCAIDSWHVGRWHGIFL